VRLGILTGGGDCPGLNAALRAVIRTAENQFGSVVIGYRHGWRGVVEGDSLELTGAATQGILNRGGTILGTSRFHPDEHEHGIERGIDTLTRDRIDTLIVAGGDGTLAASHRVEQQGIRIIGIPKTIDNDVSCTDRSIGFDTALSTATEAIDRIQTTAESHDRVMVVEVMGHHSGWLALSAGIAGGAHVVLTPEEPFDLDEVASYLRHRHQHDSFSIVVVAEGATATSDGAEPATLPTDPVAGAIGERVRAGVVARTGFETRLVVLGHLQRGGTPSAPDRLLATRFGIAATEAAHEGESGVMTALVGDSIHRVALAEVTQGIKAVPKELIHAARALMF